MAIIAAETLGVKVEDIKVHSGDTDHCPADLGAWGSRQTLMTGNAVKRACEDAKKQLLEFAYAEMGINIVYDLDIKDRWVHIVARPERGMPWEELVKMALRGKRRPENHRPRLLYTSQKRHDLPCIQLHAAGVEVEIDPETGKITIHDSLDSSRLRPADQPPGPHRSARRRILHGSRIRIPRSICLMKTASL